MLICQDRLSGNFCIYIILLPPTVQPTTGDHDTCSSTLQGLKCVFKKVHFFPVMTPIDIRPSPCVA